MAESLEAAAARRRRKPWRWLVPLVVIVVALAVGGDYLAVRLTSGDTPPTTGLSSLWSDDRAGMDCQGPTGTPWTANGLAIMCSGAGLAAVRLGTGSVAWTWKPPPVPQSVPAVLQLSSGTGGSGVDNGIGVVEYTYGESVSYVIGLRLSDGHPVWQLPTSVQAAAGTSLWVGGGRLIATTSGPDDSSGSVAAYALSTGAPDWSDAWTATTPAGCTPQSSVVLGSSVYTIAKCPDSTGSDGDQLYQLSLQTGAMTAQAPLQDTSCQLSGGYPTLWAVPGYALSACNGDSTVLDMVVIPAGGVQQHSMQWTVKYRDSSSISTLILPPDVAASGDDLYVSEQIAEPNYQYVQQIAAIDLATDTVRWEQTVSMPDEASGSSSTPVDLLGADPRGVFDLMENVNGDENSLRVTLATLAASNGSLSYGPGTVIGMSHGVQPTFALTGHTLLAMPLCATGSCLGNAGTGTLTAYNTGSWPS